MAEQNKQIERLKLAGIQMTDKEQEEYIAKPDDLGPVEDGKENTTTGTIDYNLPVGYKRCGKCHHGLKLYMFNVNNSAKNKCTGNCKLCQKTSAAASYSRNKNKRDYHEYYIEHREAKQEHSRQYYQEHKEEMTAKHQEYVNSARGKKVMRNSHKKRRELLSRNKGVAYQRDWVIDRDKLNGDRPICYLCGKPILLDREIELDHVVPVVMGGKDCFTNVACTHELCNLRKEKDARNLQVEQVEMIITRAEKYIDDHPELFEKEGK